MNDLLCLKMWYVCVLRDAESGQILLVQHMGQSISENSCFLFATFDLAKLRECRAVNLTFFTMTA